MAEPPQGLTLILGRARDGDERARGEVVALVYDELRRVASGLMRRERAGHTLSPTAVVHEAVVRLLDEAVFDRARDRDFLFAAAARAMREILVDHARRRAAAASSRTQSVDNAQNRPFSSMGTTTTKAKAESRKLVTA